jgi:hypothetical protein
MDLSHIVKEVKADYEKNFSTLDSIDEDIAEYNIDIEECMVAFISLCFGKVLSGGIPNLYLAMNEPVVFDEMVLFENPTPTEVFATLMAFSSESGDPNDYIKERKDVSRIN